MTFPVIDPTQGVRLNDAGTDIVPIWPAQVEAWLAAVLRVTLWQFKGHWKYDLRRGIDYETQILGQVPNIPVLQSIFTKAIQRYTKVDRLIVKAEGETLQVIFRGPIAAGEPVVINLLSPPDIIPIRPEAAEIVVNVISIRFTEPLNPNAAPDVSDFELLNSGATVTSVAINGTHIFLTTSIALTEAKVLYRAGTTPLQGLSRVLVDDFLVIIDSAGGFLLIDDISSYLLLGAGGELELS